MGYSKKNSNRGGWRYTFVKIPLEVLIFYSTTGNSRQNNTQPLDIPQNCAYQIKLIDLLEIPRPKAKTYGNSTLFFLVALGNSTSFLINPYNFHMLFLWYPWKFHILKPSLSSARIFSGIAQLLLILHLALFYYLSIIIAEQTCYSIGR